MADWLSRYPWEVLPMMIVRCPECSTRFKAPENMAGKKAKCKECGEFFTVNPANRQVSLQLR